MLKSALKTPTPVAEMPTYPFLAKYDARNVEAEYVILVTGVGRYPATSTSTSSELWSGVVVHAQSKSQHKIGKTSDAWARGAFVVLPAGTEVTITA